MVHFTGNVREKHAYVYQDGMVRSLAVRMSGCGVTPHVDKRDTALDDEQSSENVLV